MPNVHKLLCSGRIHLKFWNLIILLTNLPLDQVYIYMNYSTEE